MASSSDYSEDTINDIIFFTIFHHQRRLQKIFIKYLK